MHSYLKNRISILVKELMLMHGESELYCSSRQDDVLKFVLDQMNRMPWLPRFAIQLMTLLFSFASAFQSGLLIFGHRSETVYKNKLDTWRRSSLRPCRDFVRFYAAMVVLSLYSDSRAAGREAAR
jgi:hypothetical protein